MTRPRAVVVVTGSELVRGDRSDRNGPFLAQEAQLPPGWTPAMVLERYQNPPGVDLAALNPAQQFALRQRELVKMRNETGVAVPVLETLAAAQHLGKTLPALGVPATYFDEAVDRYLHPRDPNGQPLPGNTTPAVLVAARQAELGKIAAEWGHPVDTVRDAP